MTERQKAAQLIFNGAERIESGLRDIYGQWCKPPEPAFDEFTAPLFNSENRIEHSTIERLDVIAREVDLGVIEKWGDAYPLHVMQLAFACAVSAAEAATDGDTIAGWQHLNSAYFWYGQIDGREWGSWEYETHQKKRTVTKLIADRHRENRENKAIALAWYDDHRPEFTSDEDIAFEISKKVVPLAFSTVFGWIKAHKKARKSRQPPS